MAYPIEKIRNICLLGHGGDGKTSLVESLLYRTGGTDRLGKIAEGNTVSDYDPEEIKRQISIQASLAPVEYEDHILNFIDTPGFFDFDGEVAQALRVADCGVIVVAAKSGCAVGTEKAWKRLSKTGLPRFFYISKIDEENADYEKAYQSLRMPSASASPPLSSPCWRAASLPASSTSSTARPSRPRARSPWRSPCPRIRRTRSRPSAAR